MTNTNEKIHNSEIVDAVTLDELVRLCNVDSDWVSELVGEGVLQPRDGEAHHWQFSSLSITRTLVAWRLHRDLGVNIAGIAIALDLLEEREELYQRMRLLETIGEKSSN